MGRSSTRNDHSTGINGGLPSQDGVKEEGLLVSMREQVTVQEDGSGLSMSWEHTDADGNGSRNGSFHSRTHKESYIVQRNRSKELRTALMRAGVAVAAVTAIVFLTLRLQLSKLKEGRSRT